MGRRKELKSVCNDLLASFASRNNDVDGYWGPGKFQAYLQSTSETCLRFHLIAEKGNTSVFPSTLDYYRRAFFRHLEVRGLPETWVRTALIYVSQKSPSELACLVKITDDRGRTVSAQTTIVAHPHNPNRESRRCGQHSPQRQSVR